ncbi:MAG: hypothetical protein M1825_005923 [Sarcosagium campestre]|nr:MAG: hypothetical protein M1825_005923 [Sarcosagium campestre]
MSPMNWLQSRQQSLEGIPGQQPPVGVVPNFVNPESRAPKLIVANAICIALALVFVIMRLITRIFVVKSMGADDYMCIVATVLLPFLLLWLKFSARLRWFVMTDYGLGRHQWDVPLTTIIGGWLKWNIISEIIYILALMLIKSSILLLYRRMFEAKGKVRWAVDATLGFTIAFSVACIFAIIFACNPIKKLWDSSITYGTCINPEPLAIAHAALNIFTDLLILVIPIPVVWTLQLGLRFRLQIILMFATGAFVCGVSFVRLVILTKGGADNFQPDATWARFDNNLWSVIECCFGLICACGPTLKPLLCRVVPKVTSALSSRSSKRTKSFSDVPSRGGRSSDYLKASSIEDGTGDKQQFSPETWLELREDRHQARVTSDGASHHPAASKGQTSSSVHGIYKSTQVGVE